MNGEANIYIPDCPEFIRGYQIYDQREPRGAMWFEARHIVQENWGDADRMSEGVGIIIRGWNRFYAGYDQEALPRTITSNLNILEAFRDRDIFSYITGDNDALIGLFESFQEALKRTRDGRKSPVSVGKALSLFASSILPIWDSNIAYAYHCFYAYGGAEEYISFIGCMKLIAEHIAICVPEDDDRPLLKRIDEYNYSKYTMHWL